MKTKKLFLMVAMLLMSVGAFAQNGNSLKGDVNGDGKVDVADIVAIIDIMKNGGGSESDGKMYFYAGTTQPTAENYKSIATVVTDYPSETEFTPSSRDYLYILIKDDMAVEVIEATIGGHAYTTEDNKGDDTRLQTDYNTIPGHKIVRTNGKVGGKVYIKIKPALYFYYGSTQPTADNYKSIATAVTEYPSSTKYDAPFGKLYILVTSDKTVQVLDAEADAEIVIVEDTSVSIPGYKVFVSGSKVSGLIRIEIKSAQYFYVGTTQPTTENYQNLATVVAEYPSDYSYTIQSEIGRAYLYGIIASNKKMQFIEPNFNVAIDTIELTDVSIPGHKVIRSATKCSGTLPVKITDM